MDYDYPEHWATDVGQGVALAQYLKGTGEYDIFRGQTHAFPIQPSLSRNRVNPIEAIKRLNSIAQWIYSQPELASLHGNLDAVTAVSQHYGVATPFLDFTRNPEAAAFFASDLRYQIDQDSELEACIICANTATLRESWADMNERSRADNEPDLVRIVDIDVRNLWRLQAQEGLFLDVRVDANFLEMFSYFLHIRFPLDPSFAASRRKKYYPSNKSHVELLLDQYFLVESYPERERKFQEVFTNKISVGPSDFIGRRSFFWNEEFPPDLQSWSKDKIEAWFDEPDEHFSASCEAPSVVVMVDTRKSIRDTYGVIRWRLETMIDSDLRENPKTKWSVIAAAGEEMRVRDLDDGEERRLVAGGVAQIFDGMRSKPYSNTNIVTAIATYICLAMYPAWDVMQELRGRILSVELDGAGVRVRGLCGRSALEAALREDFADFLTDEGRDALRTGGVSSALRMLIVPSKMFEFEQFKELFAEQIIPSTVLSRIEEDVFHFNPAKIRVLGPT
jgi:hypothetical protein